MIACLVVLAAILGLSLQHGVHGPQAGVELGAPANPAEDPGTARPEWSFRGLFQFRELFPAKLEILPIFVISGLMVLVFFAMPLIGARAGRLRCSTWRSRLVVFGGLAVLSWQSYAGDAKNAEFAKAVAAGRRAGRAGSRSWPAAAGHSAGGALALLRNDPKTQGPRLFRAALCELPRLCRTPSATAPRTGSAHGRPTSTSSPAATGSAASSTPSRSPARNTSATRSSRHGKMAGFVKETLSQNEPQDERARS